jgi:Skp family chaperone for outer membrane proteins
MKFLKELRKFLFPFIVALSALSVSASAAFYSVSGLSKLFAGASLEVLIMASSLEISKLVIASLLYQQWNKLNKLLRFYLSAAAVILVLITSMGIYGFLSAAYQETATKSGIVDKELAVIEMKKERFSENRNYLLDEKKQVDLSITSLREGLSNNVIQYKDPETGEIITTTSSSTRRALQSQLDEATDRRNIISNKLEAVTDSIAELDLKILEVETNSDLAGELGPLKYLSELTQRPMNEIINYLLLVIIFVFDPLAIALVIAANFLFSGLIKNEESDDLSEKNDNITLEETDNVTEGKKNKRLVYQKRNG